MAACCFFFSAAINKMKFAQNIDGHHTRKNNLMVCAKNRPIYFFRYAQHIDINTFRTSISAMHYARLKKWSHNLTSKSLTKKLCVYGPLEVCKILTREGHRCLRFYYKQKRKKLLNGASNTRENNTSPALYRHCRPSWKRRANSYDTGQQRRKLHQ